MREADTSTSSVPPGPDLPGSPILRADRRPWEAPEAWSVIRRKPSAVVIASRCNSDTMRLATVRSPIRPVGGQSVLTSARQLLASSSQLRSRVVRVYGLLLAFNLVAWGLTLFAASRYPILLPTALLAYTFGLRHAVDADHIAAIDNTTRKLMQDGQRPVGVGLFFSLGHSTIVVALSVLIALSAGFISDIPTFQQIGGLIGTSVSAAFLLVIGLINLVVLIDIYRMFLLDTTDGVLMLGAYGWAYIKPIRKLYYNLTITLVSVMIAFLIGGIEVLSIVGDRLGLRGGIWGFVANLDFGVIGFGIIGIF